MDGGFSYPGGTYPVSLDSACYGGGHPCASLIKTTNYICEGDPCITGVSPDADSTNANFCLGTYDSLSKTCNYNNPKRGYSYSGSFYLDDLPTGPFSITTPRYNNGAVGSWGTCEPTHCGNGACSPGFGETCGNCPVDCCPNNCTDYGVANCHSPNTHCDGLVASCVGSGCPGPSTYATCSAKPGCVWTVTTAGTCVQ